MDVVEFLDTISEMCKEGAKTTYFQNIYSKEYEDYVKNLNTGDWDLNFMYKTYMESRGNTIGVQRREVLRPNTDLIIKWSKKFSDTGLYTDFFDYYEFTVAMKYALYAYLINIPTESLTSDRQFESSKINTSGWYIAPLSVNQFSKIVSGEESLAEIFHPYSRFIIGYRGEVELPKEYDGSTIDTATAMSFDIHVNDSNVYFNMNHDQSFDFQIGFNPNFKSGMGFMNWRGIPF